MQLIPIYYSNAYDSNIIASGIKTGIYQSDKFPIFVIDFA